MSMGIIAIQISALRPIGPHLVVLFMRSRLFPEGAVVFRPIRSLGAGVLNHHGTRN